MSEMLDKLKELHELLDGSGQCLYELSNWGTTPLLDGYLGRSWENLVGFWQDESASFVAGYKEEARLGLLLGLFGLPENARMAVLLEPPAMRVSGVREAFSELAAMSPQGGLLFDADACPGLSSREHTNASSRPFGKRKASYSGPLDREHAGMVMKTEALAMADRAWRGDVLRASVGEHRRLISQKRAENLLSAMMMGRAEVRLPRGAGSGSKLEPSDSDELLSSEVRLVGMDGPEGECAAALEHGKDVMWIWHKCLRDHHLAVTLDDADIATRAGAKALFDDIGKLVGVDELLDLYFSGGVSVEDLVGEPRPERYS